METELNLRVSCRYTVMGALEDRVKIQDCDPERARLLVRAAKLRAKAGIGKTELADCWEVRELAPLMELRPELSHATEELFILIHRLKSPPDIRNAVGLVQKTKGSSVSRTAARSVLKAVQKSSKKDDTGSFQGLASTIFGIGNMLNKDKHDWTSSSDSWTKLKKAAKVLRGLPGLLEPASWQKFRQQIRRYCTLLHGIGLYAGCVVYKSALLTDLQVALLTIQFRSYLKSRTAENLELSS